MFMVLFLTTACNKNNKTINIAVASNFEKTLKQIVKEYKKNHKRTEINIISASSGVLTAQIINNAPFDLFLSADTKKTEILFKQQILEPKVYAIGKLALWIPNSSNKTNCLTELAFIKTLAIANPKTAPYGSIALSILKKNNINIKKVIQTSNVSQAYIYTKDKLTQAGFVAYSMLEKNSKGCIQTFEDSSMSQSMILLNSKAKNIYQYILSNEIQLLIQSSGYNITKTQ